MPEDPYRCLKAYDRRLTVLLVITKTHRKTQPDDHRDRFLLISDLGQIKLLALALIKLYTASMSNSFPLQPTAATEYALVPHRFLCRQGEFETAG